MLSTFRFGALAALALAAACADATTTPTSVAEPFGEPALSQANEDPNVRHYEMRGTLRISDPSTGLVALAGWPEDPKTFTGCRGGTEPVSLWDVTEAGWKKDAPHHLMTSKELYLHVYALATFTGGCRSTPIAVGTGQAIYVDNDMTASSGHGNAWGARFVGIVELAAGGTARLTAVARFVYNSGTGTVETVVSSVELHPVP